MATAEDEVVNRVVSAWRQRQQRLARAEFQVTGQLRTPQGSNGSQNGLPLPSEDVFHQRKVVLRVDQARQAFRKEVDFFIWHDNSKQFRPCFDIFCYDGKSFQRANPPELNGSEVYQPSPIQPQMVIWTSAKVPPVMGLRPTTVRQLMSRRKPVP